MNFNGYKIQFNLLNTAPFSTLKHDDKELHYFPSDNLYKIKKDKNANLCITMMHHSPEWFHWKYKSNLENAIIDNSEFLLIGHEHIKQTKEVSINNSEYMWISNAGKADFSHQNGDDSFNVILIDTETNSFSGYVFTWESKLEIFVDKNIVENKNIQNRTTHIVPLASFSKALKEDTNNALEDFTKYFVFPKLVAKTKNNYGKYDEINDIDVLTNEIDKQKNIVITGGTNSGKSTLLKALYLNYSKFKSPLFLSLENTTRVNSNNFIKHLFEDQYGDDEYKYLLYSRLNKDDKIIIVDGWDLIKSGANKNKLLKTIQDNFGIIIFGSNNNDMDIVETVKNELIESTYFCELHIKPFFIEKRNQLIQNICFNNNITNEIQISNINNTIDSIVHNNSSIFILNPAFIINYANYVIKEKYSDYVKGEAIFSKVFEFELQALIIDKIKKSDVDEVLTTFELIAGYMYNHQQDELTISEIQKIVDDYRAIYGVQIQSKTIIDVGVGSKIFKMTDDMKIHFNNKNHLAYFIAKYLIGDYQDSSEQHYDIGYAIENVCFGINDNILLFISYLLNNTNTIMSIVEQANKLLEPWEMVDLDNKNISLLHSSAKISVNPPTDEERKQIEKQKEKDEERLYSEDIVEAIGVFDYNNEDIDKDPYRLIRAIKYTEMICKALPSFHSKLKVIQKQEIINSIYTYPRKIVYAILRPLDIDFSDICKDLLAFINENDLKKEDNSKYTEHDIREMFIDNARAIMLSMFDHFAELCTSSKSFEMLNGNIVDDVCGEIIKLMIIENNNNTDMLISKSDKVLKGHNSHDVEIMVKLIARKHLIKNKKMPFNKKTQLIDKIFGQGERKNLLSNNF